ncbi:uncharacterized protein BJX67DRAFT_315409 [Aspergillus lucknowensis]|uniref:Uncharacterized protein n=1 Tax=Aspergillus lucknowensis TaxID=176173 RepID=A0ABR4L9A8_9EURO
MPKAKAKISTTKAVVGAKTLQHPEEKTAVSKCAQDRVPPEPGLVPSQADKEGSSVRKDRLIKELSRQLEEAQENYDKLLEKYKASEVLDKDKEIRDLSDKLSEANKKYDHLNGRFRICRNSNYIFGSGFPACWGGSDGTTWGRDFRGSCFEASHWAISYGLNQIEEMEKISRNDKNYVISCLKGYFVQADFDHLIARFPEPARYIAPEILLTMLVVKDLVERFYTNSLWYLGLDPVGAKKDKQKIQQQEEFANSLYALDQRFEKGVLFSQRLRSPKQLMITYSQSRALRTLESDHLPAREHIR